MKRPICLTLLLSLMVLFTGCDAVRSMLGKPTSEEIELLRQKKAAAEKAKADSVALVAAQEAARADSLAQAQKAQSLLEGRYKVVIGSFKDIANADRLQAKVEKLGMNVERMHFSNGFEVLSVFSSDELREANRKMQALLQSDDVSYDLWIYDTERSLHK